jgi:hypothetical protein
MTFTRLAYLLLSTLCLSATYEKTHAAGQSSSETVHCYQSLITLDQTADPQANCFAVSHDGFISRVFEGGLKAEGYAYPGLWDGHGHLLQYGELLKSVDLFGSKSLPEALDRIKTYAAAHLDAGTKGQWLRGVGWDQAAFGRMPNAVSASFSFHQYKH